MVRPIPHRFLPRGHFAQAPGSTPEAALAYVVEALGGPTAGIRRKRIRLLGLGWWLVNYTCPRCPSRKAEATVRDALGLPEVKA